MEQKKEQLKYETELLRLYWLTALAVGGGNASLILGDSYQKVNETAILWHDATKEACHMSKSFTKEEAEAKVGATIRTRVEFLGVPRGTTTGSTRSEAAYSTRTHKRKRLRPGRTIEACKKICTEAEK